MCQNISGTRRKTMNDDTISRRFRMPKSYPVLCELTIDVMKWYRFERLNDYTPETNIVGHDEPVDGEITIYIACATEEVKDALEDGWN